mgnify:CR=1 FL=1
MSDGTKLGAKDTEGKSDGAELGATEREGWSEGALEGMRLGSRRSRYFRVKTITKTKITKTKRSKLSSPISFSLRKRNICVRLYSICSIIV